MNVQRLQDIIDYIKRHPEEWEQGLWHCGTTHCIAGFAQVARWRSIGYCDGQIREMIKDIIEDTDLYDQEADVAPDAREWLEITVYQGLNLFDAGNTLEYLQACADAGEVLSIYEFKNY